MLPFTDEEPIRRHDTTVEIVITPCVASDAVRADLLERIATSVGATIGPANKIVATVNVKLAIHVGADQQIIETVFRISIRFDAADDHGEGTTGWAPDVLLLAVIRNEVERMWGRSDVDAFLLTLCAFGRADSAVMEPSKWPTSKRGPDFEIAEPAFIGADPSVSRIFGASA